MFCGSCRAGVLHHSTGAFRAKRRDQGAGGPMERGRRISPAAVSPAAAEAESDRCVVWKQTQRSWKPSAEHLETESSVSFGFKRGRGEELCSRNRIDWDTGCGRRVVPVAPALRSVSFHCCPPAALWGSGCSVVTTGSVYSLEETRYSGPFRVRMLHRGSPTRRGTLGGFSNNWLRSLTPCFWLAGHRLRVNYFINRKHVLHG